MGALCRISSWQKTENIEKVSEAPEVYWSSCVIRKTGTQPNQNQETKQKNLPE